jgi:hypothetical protein
MVTEKSRPSHKDPSWVARFVPLLGWAPRYERRWMPPALKGVSLSEMKESVYWDQQTDIS